MIYSIIVGIVAGYIACKVTNRQGKGCLPDLLLGLFGGLFGGWLFSLLGIEWAGVLGDIGAGVIGAVVLLWLWNKLF